MKLERKLIIIAVLSLTAYASLYLFPASIAANFIKYIATSTVCFILYFAALGIVRRNCDEAESKRLLLAIFISGSIFRLALIGLPPFTSDDVYRYIWDGRVQAAGINPYRHAPIAPELAELRDDRIHPFISHSKLPTIYPPLAQIGFLISYFIGGGTVFGFKLLAFIAEIASGLLILKLARRIDPAKRVRSVLIYFWCPLPILEFFVSGHVDVLGIPFLILFLDLTLAEKSRKAAAALACAVLVKMLPIIFLPLVLRRVGLKRAVEFGLIFAIVVLLGYLPYAGIGIGAFGSFGTYLKDWSFNGSAFPLVRSLVDAHDAARFVCYGAIALWIVAVAFVHRDFARGMFWTLTGVYIFFPTVYPWYLSWIVPLLAFVPSRAFLFLMAASQFSYLVQIKYQQSGEWIESPIVRAFEYLPFFALLGYDLIQSRKNPEQR